MPRMAVASASEPLPMKTTSSARALTSAATRALAAPTAACGARPYSWALEGLPKCVLRYGSIASITRGSTGVVALWSR